jgi:hypothetical protein
MDRRVNGHRDRPDATGGQSEEWVMARALHRPVAAPSMSPAAALLAERRIDTALRPLLPPGPLGPAPPRELAWHMSLGPAWLAEEDRRVGGLGTWDITVVVDSALSMEFWRPVIEEIVALLRRLRLCHHDVVPVYDTEAPAARECALPAPDRTARHGARRSEESVLLLTDGLGPAWYSGDALTRLHAWALERPVAVVHLLPEKLWGSTGIRPSPRALRSRFRGAPGCEVDWGERDTRRFPVPVLELDERHLHRWARFLARGPESWTSMPTVLVPGDTVPFDEAIRALPGHDIGVGAGERLEDFATSASTKARLLAAGLAAAPLNLAVMRHVQSRLLPGSAPDLLTEIFIAGLLVPVGHRDRIRSHDRVTFDFIDGARELLLAPPVLKADTAENFRDAVRFLEHELDVAEVRGWDRVLQQALARPARFTPGPVTERSKPFLKVQLAVLKALLGPHDDLVRRLEAACAAEADASEADRDGDGEPPADTPGS